MKKGNFTEEKYLYRPDIIKELPELSRQREVVLQVLYQEIKGLESKSEDYGEDWEGPRSTRLEYANKLKRIYFKIEKFRDLTLEENRVLDDLIANTVLEGNRVIPSGF